ncbi:MAG: class I poly(R)-hydroxyalkanoic acid synthase, partial [Paracoccaceae bacterium]
MALLNANLEKIEALSQRLAVAFGKKKSSDASLEGPGQELYAKAASAYLAQMMADPGKVFEQQVSLWGEALQEFVKEQQEPGSSEPATPAEPGLQDKRFANPLWDNHPYFKLIKQQYLFGAQSMQSAVSGIQGLEPQDKKRLEFFTRQIMDMLSPANFLGTNPEALERAART